MSTPRRPLPPLAVPARVVRRSLVLPPHKPATVAEVETGGYPASSTVATNQPTKPVSRRSLTVPQGVPRRSLTLPPDPEQPAKANRVPRARQPLTVLGVQKLNKPGAYSDGGLTIGLYCRVSENLRKTWVYRYCLNGVRREASIGPCDIITLQAARAKALEWRAIKYDGVDVLTHKRVEAAKKKAAGTTFDTVLQEYLKVHGAAWTNQEKVSLEWYNNLDRYAKAMMQVPIVTIDTELVLKVLRPLWNADTIKLAQRLRMRIESVMSYAQSHGLIDPLVPLCCRWEGHLSNLLAKPGALIEKRHHSAMKYIEVGAFMHKLRQDTSTSARALAFLVMVACRSQEVREARWDEIDMGARTWAIPAERMKMNREHIVPLTPQMVALLEQQLPYKHKPDGLVFPGQNARQPLVASSLRQVLDRMGHSDLTVHGFRSTFRDYAGDMTTHERDVCEQALAHIVWGTEGAYRRGSALDKRRKLMEDWCNYLDVIQRRPLPVKLG